MRINNNFFHIFLIKNHYEKYPLIKYYRLVGWYNLQLYFQSFGISLSIKAREKLKVETKQ